MNSKTILNVLCLMALLLPVMGFAQTNNSVNSLLQFLKGDGAFERWYMEVFTQLDTDIQSNAIAASMLGRTIGGLGALMYLGYLGFQMQEGARPWEVTPMIRPIIIGMILLHWVSFYQMIQYPLQKLAQPSKDIFLSIEKQANDIRVKRFEKQTQLLEFLIKQKAEEEAKQKELQINEDKGFGDRIIEGMSKLFTPIQEWMIRMDFQFQKLISEVLEAVSLTILRVCTYFIFFIQKIWSYVLIVLGPVAVGLSLIPGFESSFQNWVAKFININLYTFVSYTIINIGQQLIISGYQLEIERYDLLLNNGTVTDLNMLAAYISNNGMIHTVLFPCVAYIVTGIGVLMTPTIADSIVSAGGAGIMTKGKSAAAKVMSMGKTAAASAATGGKAIAVSAAKTAGEMGKSIKALR
ncbi:type IV secretion system protein [Epilithonimonas vandammei]|uniref:type IV secretion system protein n=1 Tax=Epilithonimonas vandammei TaxID=2487072 RepID=UPI0028AA72AF|nr:type IV secretion system protein [Epilithonimonas vandammei]